jgi:hypothetical protein
VHATRSFAILHAAIYDAVNSIDRTHKLYLVHLSGVSRQASQEAAASAAAHEILVKLYPKFQTSLDSQFEQLLAEIPDSQGKTEGIHIEETVADDILAVRNHDGSGVTPPPFVPVNVPGSYQLTPLTLSRPNSHTGHGSLRLPLTSQISSVPARLQR